jgi:hypothetical protein
VVPSEEMTRSKYDTGPPNFSQQAEFYRMTGANFQKFLDFILNKWAPFFERFEKSAPSDEQIAADRTAADAFDAHDVVTEEDYKMLYRDNHEHLSNALNAL